MNEFSHLPTATGVARLCLTSWLCPCGWPSLFAPAAYLTLHEPATVGLFLPTAGPPEPYGLGIRADHDSLEAPAAEDVDPALGLPEQRPTEAPPTVGRVDGQAVYRPPPAIPAGDHRADNPSVTFHRNEKRSGVVSDEASEALQVIGVRRLGARRLPEVEYSLKFSALCGTDQGRHVDSVGGGTPCNRMCRLPPEAAARRTDRKARGRDQVDFAGPGQ